MGACTNTHSNQIITYFEDNTSSQYFTWPDSVVIVTFICRCNFPIRIKLFSGCQWKYQFSLFICLIFVWTVCQSLKLVLTEIDVHSSLLDNVRLRNSMVEPPLYVEETITLITVRASITYLAKKNHQWGKNRRNWN